MGKEYIEREAAINACYDGFADCRDDCADNIRNLPAADVVPARHGQWVPDKKDVEWGNYLIHYRCSECKERPHFDKDKYKFILSPYCPNCGARMDMVTDCNQVKDGDRE